MPAWLAALLTRKMLICVFTGFSSGLPLYLLLNLLPAWLRSEGVDLKTIGFFALIQFPYTWKFLWSPLLDRYSVPGFGRRRGWMLLTQVGLLFAIGSLGGLDPKENIWPILWLAALLAFLSGTQDIAVDAFRREILADNELGLGNAVHVNAYRIAGLIPGSLSLILADRLPWNEVFWITGAFMIPGMAMAWLVSEPVIKGAPKTLRQAVTEPFHEFIGRQGWRGAVMVLGFIFLYKLGDSMATALATPFYLEMGFTKTEIGVVAFPAKEAGNNPVLTGGDLATAFNNDANTLKLRNFIASKDNGVEVGKAGYFSPHKSFDVTLYPSKMLQKIASDVLYKSSAARFDGSDLMPAKVGAGTFWRRGVAVVVERAALALVGGVVARRGLVANDVCRGR